MATADISETGICNRALQKVGAPRITNISSSTPSALACNAAYTALRDAELRAHPWTFAIKRQSLAAEAVAPAWGRAASYLLPSDFLRLLPPDPEDNYTDRDLQIEGRKIFTNFPGPIQLRYVAVVSDVTQMDPLFRELLATRIAIELCETITQSNPKKAALWEEYKLTVITARKANAIENRPQEAVEDDWISVRR